MSMKHEYEVRRGGSLRIRKYKSPAAPPGGENATSIPAKKT